MFGVAVLLAQACCNSPTRVSALILSKLSHDFIHVRCGSRLRMCLNWWSDSLRLIREQRGKCWELVAQLRKVWLWWSPEPRGLDGARHLGK
jgi:hypothetical protein